MYAKQKQNSCKLTWRPVKETNNLKMSLVPSNILKILRSRMMRSAPQSWKTSNEENSWLECSRKFQRPAVLLQYTVTLKIIKRNITHLHVTHSPKNLNALICHEPCCFLERERENFLNHVFTGTLTVTGCWQSCLVTGSSVVSRN